MKTLLLGLLISGLAAAADFTPPKHVTCVVTNVFPKDANFFGSGDSKPPVIGDEVNLDFTDYTMADITFASGNALPFKEAGAKMFAHTDLPNVTHYEGIHQTPGYDYTAVLLAQHYNAGAASRVTVQILQRQRGRFFALHQLRMACTRID